MFIKPEIEIYNLDDLVDIIVTSSVEEGVTPPDDWGTGGWS